MKSGKRERGSQIAPPVICDWKLTRDVAAGMRRFDHIGPLPTSTYGSTLDQRVHRLRPKKYADSARTSSFGSSSGADPDWLTRLAYDTQEYEFGLRLPELLLMRIDRFSMANSIEARVPFLDPSLVEFVYRLPIEQKFRDGLGKVVLREAIGDIVPEWVVNRRKQGFAAPVDGWLQSQLGTLFERLIETEGVRRYFNSDVLRVALRNAKGGRGRPRMSLWPVVNFALWHHHWIERESIESLVLEDSPRGSRDAAIASI